MLGFGLEILSGTGALFLHYSTNEDLMKTSIAWASFCLVFEVNPCVGNEQNLVFALLGFISG